MESPRYVEKLIGRAVAPMFRTPDAASEQVSQALLGTRILETAGHGAWRLVRTPDGYQGWIAAESLAEIRPDWGGPWGEIADLWVNLRLEPDSRQASAAQASIGVRLPLVGSAGEWVRLMMPSGDCRWTEAHRVAVVDREPVRPVHPAAVRRSARRFLGIPYLWGGCSPMGLDCSGFVQLVMRLHGVSLPRDACQQASQGRPCPEPVTADLVFFGLLEDPAAITHVGMMLDGQRFIHAASSDRVRVNRLSDAPYLQRYRFARRVLPER